MYTVYLTNFDVTEHIFCMSFIFFCVWFFSFHLNFFDRSAGIALFDSHYEFGCSHFHFRIWKVYVLYSHPRISKCVRCLLVFYMCECFKLGAWVDKAQQRPPDRDKYCAHTAHTMVKPGLEETIFVFSDSN